MVTDTSQWEVEAAGRVELAVAVRVSPGSPPRSLPHYII
jgi:hypothetical protein